MRKKKLLSLFIVPVLFLGFTVNFSLSYLVSNSGTTTNTFDPAEVTVKVEEQFDGEQKKDVNVTNTGTTYAYIRAKLVSYRVSESELDGDEKPVRIGGDASIPDFSLGTNWIEHNGFYYYTIAVAPDAMPAHNLADSLTLEQYTDNYGGKQVIEVIAEGIQNKPKEAVVEAWGINVDPKGNLTKEGVIEND